MNELQEARNEISAVDEEMARLFERRMRAAAVIADYKRRNGLSVKDPAREQELIKRNRSYIESEEIESYYVQFLRRTIDLSCEYQARLMEGMRVTYCGVEGAFAHIAAQKMFPGAQLFPFSDFADAYKAVERGEYDCVVLPLENSAAGEVGTVMDLIFSGELFVNQVVDLSIVHNLLGVPGAALDGVKTVISHQQALDQCGEYIRSHGFETRAFSNTALAAKFVKDSGDASVAAIASDETSDIFGLNILDRGINDSKINTTRFAALSRAQNRPAGKSSREEENFILVFTVKNEAGALAQTLNIIGSHGYNMRNLRSRPMKDLQWNYFFYIEAEGNVNTENGRDMLRELSAVCAKLKLVGTFYSNLKIGE